MDLRLPADTLVKTLLRTSTKEKLMLTSLGLPSRLSAAITLITGGLVLTSPLATQAAMEAKVYSITTWNAGCDGSTRDWWDNMANAWYNEITRKGTNILGWCIGGHCGDAYSKDGQLTNGNFVNSLFADSGLVAWGNDHNHLDEGDAALIALHGFETGNVYGGALRVNEAGNGNCSVMRDEMRLGNSDLEFLHLSSCQSMDDNQWSSWWQSFNGLHQVNGFHGLMWIGSGMVNDYEDFADDAFSSSIADAWLDNMYIPNVSGNDDQCPVAYAVGANSNDMWNRIATERYNRVHTDPAVGWWGVSFIAGCDPAAETVINSDLSN
jgi:hypothetical protein